MIAALATATALSLCLYILAILPRLSNRPTIADLSPVMFAHRGYHCASKLIPENSMAAFRAAVSNGYGIELDIHLTKDGQLAVFHDDTLTRMCRVSGCIERYTYEELLTLHLQNTSEHIPLFTEVLDYVDGRVPLLIELKIPGKSAPICKAVCQALQAYRGTYLIQTFHTLGLLWFRINAPHILRGQLSSNLTKDPSPEPWLLRFLVTHLLTNFLGKPDFISYKLSDLPEPAVVICMKFFRLPVAVWTLRTEQALCKGRNGYPMLIFEKKPENY